MSDQNQTGSAANGIPSSDLCVAAERLADAGAAIKIAGKAMAESVHAHARLCALGCLPEAHPTLMDAVAGVESILKHLRAELADPPPDLQDAVLVKLGLRRICEWRWDAGCGWKTQCGHAFLYIDGTPSENGAHYCQYCGAILLETNARSERR